MCLFSISKWLLNHNSRFLSNLEAQLEFHFNIQVHCIVAARAQFHCKIALWLEKLASKIPMTVQAYYGSYPCSKLMQQHRNNTMINIYLCGNS